MFLGFFSFWLASVSVACTAGYSTRLLYYTFFNGVNVMVNVYNVKESSVVTIFVLFVLSFLSLIVGYFCKDFFSGVATDVWGSIYISPVHVSFYEEEFLPFSIRMLPFIFTLLGLSLSLFFINNSSLLFFELLKVQRFLGAK
jgi:hypothetical protein